MRKTVTSAQATTRESLVESISRDLTEQILAGRLAPGRRISQLSIAQHYGVSRLPVREALRALSSEGLVVIEPARGARVAALDSNDLREVCLMRERLEPMAVGLAVPHVSDTAIKSAEEILQQMEGLGAGNDEWLRLDRQFHTMWYDLTGMPRLVRTIEQLCDVAQRYRALFNLTPGATSISDLEHWLLLEALRRRSAPDAEALLEVHVRRIRLALDGPAAPDSRRRVGRRRAPESER
jgi:GntR family transcriptional regulator, rspAB operon transcriptional repressor